MVILSKLVDMLDRELNPGAFDDHSHNGLQVENSGSVRMVCTGVDASMEFFERAEKRGADLLICHHGLSWGDSLRRVTDINYRRLKFLIDHDMALYACHLPLDAHPRLGNNIRICRAFRLKNIKPFGVYNGMTIGFRGTLPEKMTYDRFKRLAQSVFGHVSGTMDFGKQTVRTVAVVSGGAADEVAQAGAAGIDVYVSGEPKLNAWHLAREYGINAVFGGHYATETFGVKALAELLDGKLAVKAEFVDTPAPF